MMSRFPKITETFILNEMLTAEAAGVHVELFPLRRERTTKMHPEAERFLQEAHFLPLASYEILVDNLWALMTRPWLWITTLWAIIRANFGCPRFLLGALAVFPRSITVAKRMQRSQVSHIHAHFASHPAAAAWMIHRFSDISYSFVAHGSDLHRDQHMLSEKVHAAAFVVAISEYNRQLIVDIAGESQRLKVKVIHCGVDPSLFCPGATNQEGRQFEVICVGTLHEVKGQTHLLNAAQLVRSQGVDLHIRLVGDGPDLEKLKILTQRLGLTDRVTFEGRLNRPEIISLLQKAHVLVAPSVPTSDGRREGIPVALMEGMATGAAVIASRLSGIPELIQDDVNGLLTEPGDAESIAAALLKLASDDDERIRLATVGRQTVLERFDLAANTQRVLDEIMNSSAERLLEPGLDPQLEKVTQ